MIFEIIFGHCITLEKILQFDYFLKSFSKNLQKITIWANTFLEEKISERKEKKSEQTGSK